MDRLPDRRSDRLPNETEDLTADSVSTPKKRSREIKPSSKVSTDLEILLTVEEVSNILRLSAKGIYSLIEMRRIPFVRVSNRVRFLKSDVLEWIRENRVSVLETKP